MSKRNLLLLLLLAAVAVLGVLTASKQSPHSQKGSDIQWKKIRAILLADDPRAGYEELARELKDASLTRQHVAAHIFGKVLYEQKGIEAISICDNRFVYGCFHAVVMAAIDENGLQAVDEMKQVCSRVPLDYTTQCEHGIGHGILGLLGYEQSAIEESLEVCRNKLPQSNPVSGCVGGVFMENVQRLAHDGTMRPRDFTEDDRWEPCNSLRETERPSCVFWQPMWWVSTLPVHSDPAAYAQKMGAWCMEQKDRTLQIYCVAGIGNVMQSFSGNDTALVADICRAITDDPELRLRCHLTAARRFLYSLSKQAALQSCEGLLPEGANVCRKSALEHTPEEVVTGQ